MRQKSLDILKNRENLDLESDILLHKQDQKIKLPTLSDILPLMTSKKQENMIELFLQPQIKIDTLNKKIRK